MDILNVKQKESESREQGGFIEVSVCLLLMHGYNTIYKYLQKYFVIKSLKSSALVYNWILSFLRVVASKGRDYRSGFGKESYI